MKPCCFGSHLSVAGGAYRAAELAKRLRLGSVQIFVKNQRQWNAAPLAAEQVRLWIEGVRTARLSCAVAHASYLLNLGSGDAGLRAKSRAALADELIRCDQLQIPYLVLHPGSAGDQPRTTALRQVAHELDALLDAHADLRAMPLLETTAGQGATLGRSFEELGEILATMRVAQRVGVCVDTCHVFAAGYDIRTLEGYAAMVAQAQSCVGLERIRVWHLNDSVAACGSRVDRHAHIGAGQIGAAGFRRVLADERFRGLPMILETPKGSDEQGRDLDTVNLGRLKRLARRSGG